MVSSRQSPNQTVPDAVDDGRRADNPATPLKRLKEKPGGGNTHKTMDFLEPFICWDSI
ncbi:hypothetical protein [Gluconobacter kanchanaburiensis]|uniref:hypothetical protein n=1 Tax=Gluconobacter kanchanaburiensis TaxID=563199 RepID=UPI001884AF25|nr:hypothetical protein [Gluconobacter kanchanaburiensis]MBF0861534.1 hypothetical protein [Gluconobacter kanchanaburiensis]